MSERESQRPGRLPSTWTLVRDILSFLGGWAVIFMELQRETVRDSVLVFAAGVVGAPALFAGGQLVAEALGGRRADTGGSSSSAPAEEPQQPSASR